MSITENAEPLNHPKTDAPPAGHALHESAGVHPNEHHAGAPSFVDESVRSSPLAGELEPPGQLTIPTPYEDGVHSLVDLVDDCVSSEQDRARYAAEQAAAEERTEFRLLTVHFVNMLTRLASASGCARAFLMAEYTRLGEHLLDCNLARNQVGETFETLEGVLTLMAAARTLRANLGLATGINVETLAGAFMSWMRPPPNAIPPRAQAAPRPASSAPMKVSPVPKTVGAPKPSSNFPSTPTNPGTPIAKSHKAKAPVPPAEDPKLKRERERLAKEAEKEKARAAKEAEKQKAQKRRELELELRKLK